MLCPNCNAQIDDNSMFCSNCGIGLGAPANPVAPNQAPQIPVMPNPAAQNQAMPNQPMPSPSAPSGYYAPPMAAAPVQNIPQQKKKSKKPLLIVLIVVLALLIAGGIAVAFMLFSGVEDSQKPAPTLYTTENELYVIDSVGKKGKSHLISSDYSGIYILSENNEYIVYTENYRKVYDDDDSAVHDLYCKKLSSENDEGKLIAKDIDYLYYVTGDIDRVFFTKNGDVYSSDIDGNAKKLMKSAYIERLYDDNTKLLCVSKNEKHTEENDIYSCSVVRIDLTTDNTEVLAKDAVNLFFSKDASVLYYTDINDSLYMNDMSGNTTEIAKDVNDVTLAGNNVYYTVIANEYSLYDFVLDPKSESDKDVAYPDWDDFAPDWDDYVPNADDYSDIDDYYIAFEEADKKYYDDYELANEKYEAAIDIYNEAAERIETRELILDYNNTFISYTLCMFDGNKSTFIIENSGPYAYSISDITLRTDIYPNEVANTVGAFRCDKKLEDFKKVDINTISDIEEFAEKIETYRTKSDVIISNDKVIDLNIGKDRNVGKISYDPDNSCYYFNIYNDDYSEDLYSISSTAKDFNDAKLVANDVYSFFIIDGKLTYITGLNNDSYLGTLHYGDEIIEDAAPVIAKSENSDAIMYYNDVNFDNETATLYSYTQGESERIDYNIYPEFAMIDGKYVIIKNYDDESGGSLVCIDGDEKYTIAENVIGIYNTNISLYR